MHRLPCSHVTEFQADFHIYCATFSLLENGERSFEINAETSDFIRELCVLQKVYETDESFQNVWTPKFSWEIFSMSTISVDCCSSERIWGRIQLIFEFSDSENLEVIYLWSWDRTLIVNQRGHWQHWNQFLHNYVCHMRNYAFLFLYILYTIL